MKEKITQTFDIGFEEVISSVHKGEYGINFAVIHVMDW